MTSLPLWQPATAGSPVFVLDVALPLAWSFAGTATAYTSAVMMRMVSTVVAVPACWPFQVGESFRKLERKGSATQAQVDQFLAGLYPFHIRVDPDSAAHVRSDTLQVARTLKVDSYDAAYLELSQRLNLPPRHSRFRSHPRGACCRGMAIHPLNHYR